MSVAIPRFLLPQRSPIWRSRGISSFKSTQTIRNASHKASSKAKTTPITPNIPVLEKPAKFNPPSHGSKLPKARPQYQGPPLSEAQRAAQKTKRYPHTMPNEGTFLHWFLNNRSIHTYITLGTLFSLAGYATITNFKRTSKFADMLPAASDLFFHPINFFRTCIEVLRLHTAHMSAETAERRKRKVDDVQKRSEYRKKHGLETDGVGGWTAKTDAQTLGPTLQSVEVDSAAMLPVEEGEVIGEQVQRPKKSVKKWLGIW